jgi:hypothetical protein
MPGALNAAEKTEAIFEIVRPLRQPKNILDRRRAIRH